MRGQGSRHMRSGKGDEERKHSRLGHEIHPYTHAKHQFEVKDIRFIKLWTFPINIGSTLASTGPRNIHPALQLASQRRAEEVKPICS
jgi:hypothetical protein